MMIYNNYIKMYNAIPNKIDALTKHLLTSGCVILSDVFISVGDTQEMLYFVDVEFKDKNGDYHRIYGLKDLSRF